ncbi:hypothetical protein SYK_28090 [Pseudodesulfovibrio nedwellii]|uniref:ORC1/DEAH AAA+ ATPase domain-containing protein n=1 Tax=Pseudodesulfovibrio nedwellii TaxID=2973072 RepID=A0ABN6S5C5_9BACT|nr:AAA family ATPase [Pseudodesulfovibrio nedwellii]BDQ38449.1 hypothetical protein SYK_28090 [Pseudodesulfovibrio nedwellii]
MVAKSRLNPFGDSSKDFVFFPSLSHKKGVHRIVRGLESNCGLILLTGEIGIGKTSLARYIQSYLSNGFVFVELGNPYQTPLEQVFHCCERFGLDSAGLSSIHDCVGKLEKYFHTLLENGKRPVIVFDESHLLTKRHLNLIHILSNLRAQDGPLVQILLVGQLEILDLLATEGMEALNQRIGVRCELSPLVLDDTDKYIHFKLEKGGRIGMASFSREAVEHIWKESGGLPRLINHVCAHALDGLAFKDTNVVTPKMVDEVCHDSVYTGLFQVRTKKQPPRRTLIGAGGIATLLVMFVLVVAWALRDPVSSQVASTTVDSKDVRTQVDTTVLSAAGLSDVSDNKEPRSVWKYEERVPASAPEQASVDRTQDKIKSTVEDSLYPEVLVVVEEPSFDLNSGQSAAGPHALGEPKDGSVHPVIGELVIGAIAWNKDVAASIAVINSKLLHVGESVDDVKVIDIGQGYVSFEFDGELFRRTISR